ncbi:hypothetical protein BN970_05046 [Mycolicibacterium conceptionense]|uniref:DUF4349 domain-containing protein n=1 Tax=Mycolicibacterium conceptionense TaxID=451644 RepID=A0A0U1DRJ5_9MYCO|nr:hypothetical protein BN970_05046 [Mycolicibacterium conceptionense]
MPQHTSAQRRRTTVALFAVATLVFAPACAAEHSPSSSAPAAPQSDAGFAPSAPAPEAGPSMKDAPVPTEVKRDIVKTASMSITTGNPAAVADKAVSLATDAGGRIDSRSEDAGSSSGRAHIALALRVPAAELEGTLDEFKKLGTVQTVEVRADDVTSQRVDLDARITALQTSVDRLLGIMRDAKDPDALIKRSRHCRSARPTSTACVPNGTNSAIRSTTAQSISTSPPSRSAARPRSIKGSGARSSGAGTAWCRWPRAW